MPDAVPFHFRCFDAVDRQANGSQIVDRSAKQLCGRFVVQYGERLIEGVADGAAVMI